jgi:hypothetical protein
MVVLFPAQIEEGEAVIERVGFALTLITIESVPTQPLALVPCTVYIVELAGEAVTIESAVVLRPAAGDQVKALAPLANKLVLEPEQIEEGPEICRVGLACTRMVIESVPTQPPPLTPLTVYVIELVGAAVTSADVEELSPVEGVQL